MRKFFGNGLNVSGEQFSFCCFFGFAFLCACFGVAEGFFSTRQTWLHVDGPFLWVWRMLETLKNSQEKLAGGKKGELCLLNAFIWAKPMF
jgi:hypothetical protein